MFFISLLTNYYTCRKSVKETIIEKFAGPYDQGEFSPSVQKTLYDSQCLVLNRLPEVGSQEGHQPTVPSECRNHSSKSQKCFLSFITTESTRTEKQKNTGSISAI